METFISLLKKELLGEISEAEKEVLRHLIRTNAEFDMIYGEICSSLDKPGKMGLVQEAMEAYERHRLKMKRLNFLK